MKALALSFLSLSRLRGGGDYPCCHHHNQHWAALPLSGSSSCRQGRRQLQICKLPSTIHHSSSSTRRCNHNRRDEIISRIIKSVALDSSSSSSRTQKGSTQHHHNEGLCRRCVAKILKYSLWYLSFIFFEEGRPTSG